MAIVTLQEIHKAYGSERVFENLSFQLFEKEKVGMVGANGAGKSTILKLILGEVQPDIGRVITAKGLRIGYLPQEATFTGHRTVLEEMHAGVHDLFELQDRIHRVSQEMETLSGAALSTRMEQFDQMTHEFELAGGYDYETRIAVTLKGLGFDEALFEATTDALSGGQLSRLGLAKVLMLETDLLLLDEPTNHLDLQATEWLERYLVSYPGAALVISHDRYLLDRSVCKIVDVKDRKAKIWRGNYTRYLQNRDTTHLQEQREHQRRVEMVERTRDFIARNKDQEGMRKTARGRKTRLERLLKENPDFLSKPADQKTVQFSFAKTDRKSDLIIRCEDLGKSFGEMTLFSGLTLDILAGERIGITGPNGTGKTTFLKLALGQIEPTAGSIRMGPTLKIGYLDQQADVLGSDNTVMDEAKHVNPGLTPEQIRSRLGAFLFTGDDVFKRVGDLSGGQRNRLMLCRLVLIMDEPTNHLDIASCEMLEQALAGYTGTILVVSHDRYFLDKIVDKLLVIGVDRWGQRSLGQTDIIDGKPAYSHYAEVLQQRRARQEKTANAKPKKRTRSAHKSATSGTPEELKRFNKYSVEQIEDMITVLEEKLTHLRERFGDENNYRLPERLAALQSEYDLATRELDLLYQAYERRAG